MYSKPQIPQNKDADSEGSHSNPLIKHESEIRRHDDHREGKADGLVNRVLMQPAMVEGGFLQMKISPDNIKRPRLHSSSNNRLVIQPKLTIGRPGDQYEQEADRVAEQVMRMPEPKILRQVGEEEEELIQPKPITEKITPYIQRLEEEEEEPIQAKSKNSGEAEVRPGIKSSINSIKGGGHPLSKSARSYFEPRFGYDFSNVRVHTGNKAEKLSQDLGANAFTVENDIFFNHSQYNPVSGEGKQLIAHELTHTLQQQKQSTLNQERPLVINSNHPASEPMLARQLEFEPHEITGSASNWTNRVNTSVERAQDLFEHAINAFRRETYWAVGDFKRYSERQIDDLARKITVGDFLAPIVSIAMAPIGGAVAGRVATEIGRQIVKKVIDLMNKRFEDSIEEYYSNQRTVEALNTALNVLCQKIEDAATILHVQLQSEIETLCKEIIDKVEHGEELTDEETYFVVSFYPGQSRNYSMETLGEFGVPVIDNIVDYRVDVYKNLVRSFTLIYLRATATWEETIHAGTAALTGPRERTFEGRAEQIAEQEAENRRRSLEYEGRQ